MEQIIELSKLSEEGLVIEESKEFKQSIFSAVYQDAKMILKEIVRENGQLQQTNSREACERRGQEEINNIVSFEGRRGTGKTSVMLSIQKALKNYRKDPFLELDDLREAVSFVVLDYIDASLLESKENILTMVLSSMFLKLRDFDTRGDYQFRDEYGNKELYQQFERVYANVLTLTNQEENQRNISPLRILNELSNSQVLKKSLEKLISQYLKCLSSSDREYGCSRKRFLVISIDDLDMRFNGLKGDNESPFEMVEMIHRYLMLPNVIILLTYNYEDLCQACEKHFYKIYPQSYWNDASVPNRVKNLTVEYLNKIIPIYRRVHMPSMKKKDYTDGNELMIRVEGKEITENFEIFKEHLCREQDFALLSVKEFAMMLKAAAIGLYYDAKGEKRHFSEPSSLRELAQFYQFYKRISVLCSQGKEALCFKELLDDLYFRFLFDQLSDTERRDFNRYLDVSIERRSKDIVKDIVELNGERYSEITYIGKERSSYSYGELLFGLYQASHDGLFSKSFIWCILESYTIILTRLYRRIISSQDEQEREKSRKQMLAIAGASISSSWSNRMVPKWQRVSLTDQGEELEDASDYRLFLDLEHTSLVNAAAVKHSLSFVELKFVLPSMMMLPLLEEDFQMFEILGMFFTNVKYRGSDSVENEGFHVKYLGNNISFMNYNEHEKEYRELENSEQSGDTSKLEYDIQFTFSDACFNIMNFVVNLLSWDAYFEQLHASLKEAYRMYFNDLESIYKHKKQDNTESLAESFMKEHSLKKKYQAWYHNYKGFAMPIYSFDMMYNILKRRWQNQGTIPAAVKPKEYWSYVMEAYMGIGELLKAEEEFYFGDITNDDKVKKNDDTGKLHWFYQAYMECPFIQYVMDLELEGNEARKKKFENRFCNMLMSIVAIEK